MCSSRYHIPLRVSVKNIPRVIGANEWNIFQHSKRNFESPSGQLYKHKWNSNWKPFNFRCERRNLSCHRSDVIFNLRIEDNTLFSLVKISCFRATVHLTFHWCLYDLFLRRNYRFCREHCGDYSSDDSENKIIKLSLTKDEWVPKLRYYWGVMLMTSEGLFFTTPLSSLRSLFSG